jgi:UDP-N-acetyl-D-glucosamine dehydrogenase
MPLPEFKARIDNRQLTVAVIGLGYVGLPLIIGLHAKGFRVIGLDLDQDKITSLKDGRSYIAHIDDEEIKKFKSSSRFSGSTEPSAIRDADAVLICVPTPLTRHLEPDMTYIVSTCQSIAPHVRRGQLIVLESTTYPGTTRELMVPLLEKGSGLVADKDFHVAFSPEREDPGNPHYQGTNIPKIVGATSPVGLQMVAALYAAIVPKVVPVSSADAAEAVKLTENIFRAVNIAMVNELKLIYDAMGIDVWEVIDAAKTKPFGFMPFYPGPGLGGHCIPIDPFYLTWKAREYGMATRFIELAGQINRDMPGHVVRRLEQALGERRGKPLKGARILLIGIAYKKNVDDMRESPSLVLIEMLEKRGAITDYYDPHIPVVPMTREHADLAGRTSVPFNEATFARYDAVLIATDHDSVDWARLGQWAPLIIDTRNAMARLGTAAPTSKIVKA